MQNIYQVHNIDARKINNIVSEPVVDVTITSPPYFDMKDYGSDNQIGYGQKYDEYLNDWYYTSVTMRGPNIPNNLKKIKNPVGNPNHKIGPAPKRNWWDKLWD